MQQGDPLGPLLFCLVLHKLVATIASDEVASHLLYHKWYMDDGVVAGTRNAVARVIAIIKEQGPHLGLFIKDPKCDLNSFSSADEKVQHTKLGASGCSNRGPDFLRKIHRKSSLQEPWSAFQIAADWSQGLPGCIFVAALLC